MGHSLPAIAKHAGGSPGFVGGELAGRAMAREA
jgi:hypothetical protein